jgi:hypothetical protein
MDSLHAQGDGCLHVAFGVINKQDFLRLNRSPFHGPLKDSQVRFLKSHFIGENPLLERGNDRECCNDVVKVERIGIGKKTESPFPFQGTDDF